MLYSTNGLGGLWDDVVKSAIEGGVEAGKGTKFEFPNIPLPQVKIAVDPRIQRIAAGAYMEAKSAAQKKVQAELTARANRYAEQSQIAAEKFPTTPLEEWMLVGTEAVKDPSIVLPMLGIGAAIVYLARRR